MRSRWLVEELRGVVDPELGVNIVDLGLVYGAQLVDGVAHVLLTTTTPACPIGSYLRDEVRPASHGHRTPSRSSIQRSKPPAD